MLIKFSVANFRSICEEVTLDFAPIDISKETEHIIGEGNFHAVNVAVFYGANASGKSNLIKAIALMRKLVRSAVEREQGEKLIYDPFLLRRGGEARPTKFEAVFLQDKKRWRYGFSYVETHIEKEWLFYNDGTGEKPLFARIKQEITVDNEMQNAVSFIPNTSSTTFFLSVCKFVNISDAVTVITWFNELFLNNNLSSMFITKIIMEDDKMANNINKMLKMLKLGFGKIKLEKTPFNPNELSENMSENIRTSLIKELSNSFNLKLKTFHALYDENKNKLKSEIKFDLEDNESLGTQQVIRLIGPMLVALEKGGVLIIDEIEDSLHTILSIRLIELFLSKENNTKGAQLIFTTHDTSLLSYLNLQDDQIYLVNKDKAEATNVVSLVEYKNIKTDKNNRESDYLSGIYGGVPYLEKVKLKIDKNGKIR